MPSPQRIGRTLLEELEDDDGEDELDEAITTTGIGFGFTAAGAEDKDSEDSDDSDDSEEEDEENIEDAEDSDDSEDSEDEEAIELDSMREQEQDDALHS